MNKIFHKVENNEIVEYNKTLPFSIERIVDGKTVTTVLGVNASVEEMVSYGYYPEVSNLYSFDTETHKNDGVSYQVVGTEVHKNYNIVEIPIEEIMEAKFKQAEEAVQAHINSKCRELGYDNENSIAKYLVAENPFYAECKAISLWIGAVWTSSYAIQTQVVAGTIPEPTAEELIAMLPVFGV